MYYIKQLTADKKPENLTCVFLNYKIYNLIYNLYDNKNSATVSHERLLWHGPSSKNKSIKN